MQFSWTTKFWELWSKLNNFLLDIDPNRFDQKSVRFFTNQDDSSNNGKELMIGLGTIGTVHLLQRTLGFLNEVEIPEIQEFS